MLNEISILELEIFAEVSHLRSLRSVARARGLQVSHVSKVIRRLEKKLGTPLLKRSATGVMLTREGLVAVETVEKILQQIHFLEPHSQSASKKQLEKQVLTVGSVAFLNNHLLAPVLHRLEELDSSYRFRLLDISPDKLVPSGLSGTFELALHIGLLPWTKLWVSQSVGYLTWGLFGRSRHPLAQGATPAEVQQYPFVVPTYWTADGFAVGNDYCPLPWRDRIKGHETSTAEAAVQATRTTDHLAFVPRLAAKSFVELGEVTEIRVAGWAFVKKPLYLTVKSDVISQRFQKSTVKFLSHLLEK